jgi:hypothetical protein
MPTRAARRELAAYDDVMPDPSRTADAHERTGHARYLATNDVDDVSGAVVVVDVLRAFTTAAYALAGGARHIYLVGVDEARVN